MCSSDLLILGANEETNRGVKSCHLHADGQYANKLWIERPGTASKNWISHQDIEKGLIFPKMDGRYVFKHAVQNLTEVVKEALTANHLAPNDIDVYVFHQANTRINNHVATVLGIASEKVVSNIDKYGNCSAGSIPMLLDESVRYGIVKPGSTICMAAFGSGFTWASCIINW